LVTVSDGSAVFGESAYDPVVLWGWMEAALKFIEISKDSITTTTTSSTSLDLPDIRWPSHSTDDFLLFYGITNNDSHHSSAIESEGVLHTVITDIELEKPIGMISILQNNPKHLSARLGKRFMNISTLICIHVFVNALHTIYLYTCSI